jgi:putative resolvase
MIKLSKFAKDLGVSKQTLWNWKNAGKLEFIKVGGLNFVDVCTYNKFMGIQEKKLENAVIYCRVSSTVNKSNLETQKERLINYCNAKGYKVSKVVTEFGSGMNDSRPKLEKLLKELDFTHIVVEHKDRLTRFGFNYIDLFLASHGIKIEAVNNVEDDKQDIIQDFTSIITSFCARIYGQRRSKRKTEKIIAELEKKEDNDVFELSETDK